jgi:hypothetical protein
MSLDRKRSSNCVAPSFSISYAFGVFLWGDVKDHMYVYSEGVNTLDELKAEITAKTANFTRDMLERVWQELNCRGDVSRTTDGAHCHVFRTEQLSHLCVKDTLFQSILQTTALFLFSFLSCRHLTYGQQFL